MRWFRMTTEDRPLALSAVVFSHRYPGRRMILTVGSKAAVLAEVAATSEDTRKGLSNRVSLNDGEGMLFVMPGSDRLSFWMRDTTIPLSIAFLAEDGTIQEIRDMRPLSEEHVVSERPARLALEVPQGWFAKKGVLVGDRVTLGR